MFVRVFFFFLESTVINFGVNKGVKVFPRKVIVLICRRNVSSAPRWTHYRFVFLGITSRVGMKCILCQYGNFPYEKYLRLEEDEQFVVLQDKRLWIVSKCQMFFFHSKCKMWRQWRQLLRRGICIIYGTFWMVGYFSYRPWYVLLFDGKNDRCWMVLTFWDTFNIEIDCSVMCLSCLDELLNNDIFLVVFISVICVICLAKRIQYFGGTFGLWRLMFLFLSFFARNDNISFGWNFVREE